MVANQHEEHQNSVELPLILKCWRLAHYVLEQNKCYIFYYGKNSDTFWWNSADLAGQGVSWHSDNISKHGKLLECMQADHSKQHHLSLHGPDPLMEILRDYGKRVLTTYSQQQFKKMIRYTDILRGSSPISAMDDHQFNTELYSAVMSTTHTFEWHQDMSTTHSQLLWIPLQSLMFVICLDFFNTLLGLNIAKVHLMTPFEFFVLTN